MSTPALYTAAGVIELTPEQHLCMLLDRLAQENQATGRWNARREEALRRADECANEALIAEQSAANLREWIDEYAKHGITVS